MAAALCESMTAGTTCHSILYAEDSENNVLLVSLYLKGQPYALDVAQNGMEAVDKFKQGHYDIILMDIQMPVMDGVDATTAIRKYEQQNNKKHTPIIAITAHSMEENKRRAMDAGCDLFVTKPITKTDLLGLIQGMLD